MTPEEIQAHITWLLDIIGQTRTAITELSTGKIQSYTIDTGQTKQSVTKKDVSSLRVNLKGYLEDLVDFRLQLGGGTSYVRQA